MSIKNLTTESLPAWLQKNNISEVECVTPDMAGLARGKAMPANKMATTRPTFLPISIFFQSITGNYIENPSPQFETEIDLRMMPDLETVTLIPWANEPSVQIINDLYLQNGEPLAIAPRAILRKIIELYAEHGWQPIIAPELEFYLTAKNTDPDLPLEPPIGRSGRQGLGRQPYSMMSVDEYEPIIEAIYDFASTIGMNIDTIIQEDGTAQLEINLLHDTPLKLADQVFNFKRLIREAAFRNGCYATFMARPIAHQPGSAMHIHQSVIDKKTGRNLFTNLDGSASRAFHYYIGGLQSHFAAATCFAAPYVNSYRRLTPGEAAPINLEWGADNRTVGFRVPISDPQGRRVENRITGADANPYLAISATLACGYLGLINKLKPSDPTAGSAYAASHGLPRSLHEALELLKRDKDLRAIMGAEFCDLFTAIKKLEYEEYMHVVSPWERQFLLLNV